LDSGCRSGDEKRLIVQADKQPTAFVEVEWALRAYGELI
jgi:hypothetical protein